MGGADHLDGHVGWVAEADGGFVWDLGVEGWEDGAEVQGVFVGDQADSVAGGGAGE